MAAGHSHMHNCTPAGQSPSLPAVLVCATTPVFPIFHQLPEPDLSCNWVLPSSHREGPHSPTWNVRPGSSARPDLPSAPRSPTLHQFSVLGVCTDFPSARAAVSPPPAALHTLNRVCPPYRSLIPPLIRATGTRCPLSQVPVHHSTPPSLHCPAFHSCISGGNNSRWEKVDVLS